MSKKLESIKTAENLDLTTNQGSSHNSSYVATNGDIKSDITLKNRLSKIKDIKNDITNLSNFKLDNDSKNDIIYNLLNQQVKASGYRLDWISFTVDLPLEDDITRFERLEPVYNFFDCFNINFEEFEIITGQNFYNRGKTVGGFLKVFYSEEDEKNPCNVRNMTTANIIITGQGCSYLHEMTTTDNKEYYILSKVYECAKNITRLDIALDLFEPGILSLDKIGEKLDNDEFVSPKRSKNVIKEDDGHGDILGHTRYLGSKRAGTGTYLRAYNKLAQAKKKGLQLIDIVKQTGFWERYEISINGDEHCRQVINSFLYEEDTLNDMDKIYKQLISSIVTFKEPTYSNKGTLLKDKRDWRTSEFWLKFLDDNQKFEFNSAGRDPQFIDMLSWISATVTPTLFVLDEILSSYDISIFDVLKEHNRTYTKSKKQERAILNATKLSKSEIETVLKSFKTGELKKSYIKQLNKELERRVTVNGQDISKK
jgi:phage replication initiation protein